MNFVTSPGMSSAEEKTMRDKAFRSAKGNTIRVKLLRFALPACAAGLMGLYFLPQKVKVQVGNGVVEIEDVDTTGRMINPTYSGSDEKNGKYFVTAEHAIPDLEKRTVVELHKITARTESKERGWMTMTATQGFYQIPKGQLELKKGIDIKTSNGMEAQLKSALVEMKAQTVLSREPVAVKLPNGTVRSDGLLVLASKDILRFERNVQVHLETPQESRKARKGGNSTVGGMFRNSREPIDVASEELEINDKSKTATFRGQVSAVQAEMSLQAKQLKIDYNANGGSTPPAQGSENGAQSIKQVTAIDDVIISSGDGRQATAQVTVFDNEKQLVTLDKNVVVKQGNNTLRGKRLVIDLKKRHSYFPPGGRIKGRFVPKADPNRKKKKPKPVQVNNGQNDNALVQSFSSLANDSDSPFDISANQMDIYDLKQHAVFRGNVHVVRSGNQIRAGYLRLNYNGASPIGSANSRGQAQGSQIQKIFARKKVLITTANDQALSGDEAVFNVKTNIVVVTGNVTVTQAENVLKGEKVVINLNTGIFQLQAGNRSEPGNQRVRTILTPGKIQLPGQQ